MAGFGSSGGGGLAEELHRVPMWGWAALAAGGVGVFFYVRSKSSGASTTAATSADTSALAGQYTNTGGDTSGGSTSGGTPVTVPTGPDTKPGGGTSGGTSGGKQPGPSTPPTPANKVYIVQPGDTLWAIGSRNGKDAQSLYSANASVIESTARDHGFANSDGGHWIFPGEQLVIPA